MAFTKTGIAVTPPQRVEIPRPLTPEVGEERDGEVWDGEKWIPKTQWEARSKG